MIDDFSTENVDEDGTRRWVDKRKSRLHRVDGPAIIRPDGTREWWLDGKRHRVNAPALIRSSGLREWYLHGELHRENGPAVEGHDGTQRWFRHGKRHRVDGPASTAGHHMWFVEDYLVDVTVWQFERLSTVTRETRDMFDRVAAGERNVPVPLPVHPEDYAAYSFSTSSMVTPQDANLFCYLKSWCDVSMLTHVNMHVRAIASWHLPVDDHYLDAAFCDTLVRKLMMWRPDVDPETYRQTLELLEVAQ